MRSLRIGFLVFSLLLFLRLPAGGAEPDPIEGKWLGETGTPDNRARVGLEIVRGEDGKFAVFYTLDLVNFHRVPLPPLERLTENRYTIAAYKTELTLSGDRLQVTALLDDPLELHRTDQLPAPRVQPDWPRGPEPRWQVRLGGAIFAAPVVRDGLAYVGNTDGVLFALNIADGARAWAFPAGRPIHSEAVATGDALYFTCDNGYLFKLNRADGKEVWRYDLGDGLVSRIPPNPFVFDYDHRGAAPLLEDGVLFVGAAEGGFHAVDATTGKRLWRVDSGGKIRTSPAVHGQHIIVGTLAGHLLALDRADGKEAWRQDLQGPLTSSPVVLGNLLVIGSRGAVLRGLDARTGAELWSRPYWGSWVESSAVFHDGKGYIGSGDLFLVSEFEPASGRNLWRTHVHGWVLNRPVATDEYVFAGVSGARRRPAQFLKQAGGITAIRRATGEIAWHWPMPEWPGSFLHGFFAPPVVAGSTLLAAGVDGTLYAFPLDP